MAANSSPANTPSGAVSHGRDVYIWGTFCFLLIVSIIELFSASSQEVHVGDIYGPIIRHGRFLLMGVLIMLGIERVHFRVLYHAIPIFVIVSILMMIWVLIGGVRVNGVKRAFMLGSIMVLPAEFLKLSVALGIAWILSRTQIKVNGTNDVSWLGVILSSVLVLVGSLLLFNQGLTNTLLLMSIALSMMIIGGISWRKIGITFGVYFILGLCAMGIKAAASSDVPPTRQDTLLAQINQEPIRSTADKDNRMHTWSARIERHFRLNKSGDPIDDENKQEQLSFIAQARGGLSGVGLGNSRETSRLPLAFSDYIFAIIVEELGSIIAIGILCLYLFLLGRAGRLAQVFNSTFATFLVTGCSLVICLQALFHVAIVVGVFPVSGQPLPLISKGGTSIIATSIALGVMLSCSRWAARRHDSSDIQRQELNALNKNIASKNPNVSK